MSFAKCCNEVGVSGLSLKGNFFCFAKLATGEAKCVLHFVGSVKSIPTAFLIKFASVELIFEGMQK